MNLIVIIGVIVFLVIAIGGGLGYYFYSNSSNDTPVNTAGANTTTSGTTASQVVSGQYVRLRQPTVGCMNIGDIKVISNGTNIAKGKTVTISSIYEKNQFPGTYLVDEIFSNFAHTSCNDAGWMMIDLGSSQKIDSVIVHNRADCCTGRILGAVIEILDSSKTVVYTSDPFADKSGKTTPIPGGEVTGISTYVVNPPSKSIIAT